MIKGKNAQYVILSESQIVSLVTSSVRNIVDIDIESGKKVHNNFIVTIVLECVAPEMFPEYDLEDIGPEDYSKEDMYASHLVEQLEPFGVSMFRVNNKENKQKLWGLEMVVNQKNVADFVAALADIEDMWLEVDAEEDPIGPSKGAVLVDGNETLN
jgi:hypothetical protein